MWNKMQFNIINPILFTVHTCFYFPFALSSAKFDVDIRSWKSAIWIGPRRQESGRERPDYPRQEYHFIWCWTHSGIHLLLINKSQWLSRTELSDLKQALDTASFPLFLPVPFSSFSLFPFICLAVTELYFWCMCKRKRWLTHEWSSERKRKRTRLNRSFSVHTGKREFSRD